MLSLRNLGHGVGLRPAYFADIMDGSARAEWFEVISENYMIAGGRPLRILERARSMAPIVLHGVSMNLGGCDPLREDYLIDLAALAEHIEPAWISDHLCWCAYDGRFVHDLMPLPFTEEALAHVSERIRRVQDKLGRQILIENVSSYFGYRHSTMTEWEFLAAIAEQADCGILLDVNNVYVSAINHGFDPLEYLEGIPCGRVGQFHLAGHTNAGTHLVDTHDQPVSSEVWELHRAAVRRFGRIPSLIERDDNIPPLSDLLAEAEHARTIEAEELADCANAA